MLSQYFNRDNKLHLTIGEEGVVVLYYVKDRLSKKLFIRTTSDQDTVELRKILLSDNDAKIHIYVDILDQSYMQKTLPAISVFSIDSLAQKRLEKETPKTHLKNCLRVGRLSSGRKDWIYVFISTAFEPPISNWVAFLSKYQNIIVGIHFLPIEMACIVDALKDVISAKNVSSIKPKLPFIDKVKALVSKDQIDDIPVWEVLLTLNKSGGFRQAVYQNGKVIFTRLLNSISDPNPDVIAGNIEQEIANSLEYLRRLSLREKDEIKIYMVISGDIKKHIRKEKFNTTEVHIFTPYEAAKLLHIPENITKEGDRFCDPLILDIIHRKKTHMMYAFTEELGQIFLYHKFFKWAVNSVKVAVPLIFLLSCFEIFSIFSYMGLIKNFEIEKSNLSSSLSVTGATKAEIEQKFGSNADVEQIKEVVELYQEYSQYNTTPLTMLQKIGDIRPDISRVKEIEIRYDVPKLRYTARADAKGFENNSITQYQMFAKIAMTFKNFGTSYEELRENYKDYLNKLQLQFKEYQVSLSSLPDNFSFDDVNKPLSLQISLQYPKSGLIEEANK